MRSSLFGKKSQLLAADPDLFPPYQQWSSTAALSPDVTDTSSPKCAQIAEHPAPPVHLSEWRASQVTDRLIAANVRYTDGNEAVDLLTQHAISEMGGHAAQYATTPVIKLRQRYSHVLAGGWWVSGLDPLEDWQPMDWGQFKPLHPRTSWKNPDKVIKYEAPAKQSTRTLFLSLPWTDGLNIAQRHQLGPAYQYRLQQAACDTYPNAKNLSHAQTLSLVLDRHSAANPEDQDKNFWSWWLSNPKAPIVITEGAKKAGAALTAGYAT
ncbi:MAG: DUF3854 domain-containing protein, partial [Cyanobacteria bacterium J06576_12]